MTSLTENVGVDETLLEIFESEVSAHIQAVEDFIKLAKASEAAQLSCLLRRIWPILA